MKMLTGSVVLVAATLALSACGGSHKVVGHGPPPHLPVTRFVKRLRSEARDIARSLKGGNSVKTAQVYGPNSRYLLVKASSGDLVKKAASERTGFYLIVLHGHFICAACSAPGEAMHPHGDIATEVWSPKTGSTDFGIDNRPVAMSRLRGPVVFQISG